MDGGFAKGLLTTSILVILTLMTWTAPPSPDPQGFGTGEGGPAPGPDDPVAAHGEPGTRTLGFSPEFADDEGTLEAKQKRPFNFKVTNTGNQADSYSLTIDPLPANWTAHFPDQSTSMELLDITPGAIGATSVFVKAPKEGSATVTVWVESLGSSAKKKAELRLTVAKPPITLVYGGNEQSTDVGGEVAMEVQVANNNATDEYNVTFLIENLQLSSTVDEYNWTYSLSRTHALVDPGATEVVEVTIRAPKNANSGESATAKLMGQIMYDSEKYYSNELTVTVEAKYNLYVPPPAPVDVSVNTDASFTLSVRNNGRTEVTVDEVVPFNWPSWATKRTIEPSSFTLASKQTRNVQVSIPMTIKAPYGSHELTLHFPIEGTSYIKQVELQLNVSQVFGLDWDTGLPGNDEQLTMDGAVSFVAGLKSSGNGVDRVAVEMSHRGGWSTARISGISTTATPQPGVNVTTNFTSDIQVSSAEGGIITPAGGTSHTAVVLLIPAGEEAFVWMTVEAVAASPPEDPTDTISLVATSLISTTNTTATGEIPVRLKVAEVELSLEIPSDLEDGDDTKINARVKNVYSVSTGPLTVSLYVDSKLVSQETITGVSAGATKTVELAWDSLERGEHLVSVKVTGSSIEPVEESIDPHLTVVGEKTSGDGVGDDWKAMTMVILAVIVALVIAVVVLLVVMASRSKTMAAREEKDSQKAEYDKLYGSAGGGGASGWEGPDAGEDGGESHAEFEDRPPRGKAGTKKRKVADKLHGEDRKALPREGVKEGRERRGKKPPTPPGKVAGKKLPGKEGRGKKSPGKDGQGREVRDRDGPGKEVKLRKKGGKGSAPVRGKGKAGADEEDIETF